MSCCIRGAAYNLHFRYPKKKITPTYSAITTSREVDTAPNTSGANIIVVVINARYHEFSPFFFESNPSNLRYLSIYVRIYASGASIKK